MSSAYHPETDGATERANKTIGSMLRQCIKGRQSDWVRYLAGIEYAMNASVSETTGYSPFYLNFGRVPPPMIWETENEYAGFPGRSGEQIIALDKEPKEWAVDKILTHAGKGRDAEFQILWKSGDKSWESFERIRHLEAMDAYLEAQGVSDATELVWTDPLEEDKSEEEGQLEIGEKGE
ncbi:Gag-Pol polyprotein/retrotransposon [Ceratobasidium sp. AG-Ba]|nr:Gag-Pol polyprotein/retrotransposon [Ceratobasidium sp. AG-Ba]QRV98625.1 Gag-Pol polyprotein/retrotransposon [Ceratobasidium sp. AG-Ba]